VWLHWNSRTVLSSLVAKQISIYRPLEALMHGALRGGHKTDLNVSAVTLGDYGPT
jgi:hypothetical protein